MRLGVERRLQSVRDEIGRVREQLRIIDEQVAYVGDVAEETRVRAVVSSTPLADREATTAAHDLRRTRVQREELADRLADLVAEQDRLLEQLFERGARGA